MKYTELSYIYRILDKDDNIVYVDHLYQVNLLHPLERMVQIANIIGKLPESTYTVQITHTFLITDELALSTLKYLKIKKLEKKSLYEHRDL